MVDEPPVTSATANYRSTSVVPIRTTDSVPTLPLTPSEMPPPPELRETHFALHHYLTPRIAVLVQAPGKAKAPHEVMLAVKVSFISVIPFPQWETHYSYQLFPTARQSCLCTESPIFRYFQ